MNSNDFVSVDYVLADILSTVNDEKLRNGFSRGWYVSRINRALRELAFDTFFSKITLDLEFDREKLAVEMPSGIFNIREIYLYNSACCSPSTSQVVHWKRLYNNKGNGPGHTAKIKESGGSDYTDPFLPSSVNYGTNYYPGQKFYANIQNGTMMFSPDCASYSKVRIIANGIGGDIGDIPIIPVFLEQAVSDFVIVKYYRAMKARDPRKYRSLWMDAKNDLEDMRNGSWRTAKMRVSSMDTWEKESLEEYISAIYHK